MLEKLCHSITTMAVDREREKEVKLFNNHVFFLFVIIILAIFLIYIVNKKASIFENIGGIT